MKILFSLFFTLIVIMDINGQPTKFYLPVGTGYEVQLLEYNHENGQIAATIEVTPEVWEFVDLVMLFNLTWDNRNAGEVSGQKPVVIKMMFDTELYESLKKSNELLVDSAQFLAASAEHPMRSTKKWYAIEVTEEVDLPDHLADKGTLRQGFTTTWKEVFEEQN